jgi:hypothetical protein
MLDPRLDQEAIHDPLAANRYRLQESWTGLAL